MSTYDDSLTLVARHIVAGKKGGSGDPKAPKPFSAPINPRFTRALVCAVNVDGTVSVCVDGSATAVNADWLTPPSSLTVGEIVELHTFGTRLVIDGVLASEDGQPYDTGWVGIPTFHNAWVPLGSFSCALRRIGNHVKWRGVMTNVASSSTDPFVIPGGFGPAQQGNFACANFASSAAIYLTANPNGSVAVNNWTLGNQWVALDSVDYYTD